MRELDKAERRAGEFFDACLMNGVNWHYKFKGNICLADGHVVFDKMPPPTGGDYNW